jgi:FkbM family methyltransferase
MGIKRKLADVLENLFGVHIYREVPIGISVDDDIARRLPNYRLDMIFDVGANIGQSAYAYLSDYPYSTIYCFEPIAETFKELESNMRSKQQVKCFQLAFGASTGNATMTSEGTSTMNCVVNEDSSNDHDAGKTEIVNSTTLDDFCIKNDVRHISYLKIDTEGGDFDVLKGADNMFSNKHVDIVEVEAGMNPHNHHHVAFEILKEFLEGHGYLIFGVYEQVNEWPEGKPNLRRANAVFISEAMVREYSTGAA